MPGTDLIVASVPTITLQSPPGPAAECWRWRAVYSETEWLDEVDEQGREHGFKEVDQSRLTKLILFSQRDHLPHHVLQLDPSHDDMRPIFYRRRQLTISHEGEQLGNAVLAHILGWQKTVRIGKAERNVASYTFLFDDGSVLVTDDYQAI